MLQTALSDSVTDEAADIEKFEVAKQNIVAVALEIDFNLLDSLNSSSATPPCCKMVALIKAAAERSNSLFS